MYKARRYWARWQPWLPVVWRCGWPAHVGNRLSIKSSSALRSHSFWPRVSAPVGGRSMTVFCVCKRLLPRDCVCSGGNGARCSLAAFTTLDDKRWVWHSRSQLLENIKLVQGTYSHCIADTGVLAHNSTVAVTTAVAALTLWDDARPIATPTRPLFSWLPHCLMAPNKTRWSASHPPIALVVMKLHSLLAIYFHRTRKWDK